MKKNVALILTAAILAFCLVQSAGAISVIMNSASVAFKDQQPIAEGDNVIVPLREIAETLGLDVLWDETNNTVRIEKDNYFIELKIGSKIAKTPYGSVTMEAAPKIVNGRTMVPMKFIAETLKLDVSWNEMYQRIIINGAVDTEVETVPTEPSENEDETNFGEAATENESEAWGYEVPTEEFIVIENLPEVTFYTQSKVVTLTVPEGFTPENTDDENGFASNAIDGLDAEHLYDWSIVKQYLSYTDGNDNGIVIIVQKNDPYRGAHDYSRAMDVYPEEALEIGFEEKYFEEEIFRIIIENICAERGLDVPQGYKTMETNALAALLGFADKDEYDEYMAQVDRDAIIENHPLYIDWVKQFEERSYNSKEKNEIDKARNYALRFFSEIYGEFKDSEWVDFFDNILNTDEEVRYEDFEILHYGEDGEDEAVIHATIWAEDPDDEQGVFEYYYYIDGDSVVTIYSGSLYSFEIHEMADDIVNNMTIRNQ